MKYIESIANQSQIDLASNFARGCARARVSVYESRGQSNIKTIESQILSSKIAEFAVFNYLRRILPNEYQIKIPDTTVTSRPSFDSDIQIRLRSNLNPVCNVNIKSQEEYSVQKYGTSWVFQKEDRLFTRKANEILVLSLSNKTGAKILSLGKVSEFEPFLDEMKKKDLNTTKKALYYKPESVFDISLRNPLECLTLG